VGPASRGFYKDIKPSESFGGKRNCRRLGHVARRAKTGGVLRSRKYTPDKPPLSRYAGTSNFWGKVLPSSLGKAGFFSLAVGGQGDCRFGGASCEEKTRDKAKEKGNPFECRSI